VRRDLEYFLIGSLVGLAVGAVIGLLFAPVEGRRLRRRIADEAIRAADAARDLADKTEDVAGRIVGRVDHYLGRDEEAAWRKVREIREGVSRYSQTDPA
jgi:gas vesicle protein